MTLDTKIYYREVRYDYETSRTVRYQTRITPAARVESERIVLDPDGILTLIHPYAWDGATLALDTRTNMRGSAVHDALIQLVKLGLLPGDLMTKLSIDLEYYRFCREDGMGIARGILHLGAIQKHRWQETKTSPEKEAP
jgi:hypothetical protein